MGFVIVLLASIPAYIGAGLALFLGAGWGMALLVLAGTGTLLSFLIGALLAHGSRDDSRRDMVTPA